MRVRDRGRVRCDQIYIYVYIYRERETERKRNYERVEKQKVTRVVRSAHTNENGK